MGRTASSGYEVTVRQGHFERRSIVVSGSNLIVSSDVSPVMRRLWLVANE